jgi:hypothetical protein
MHHSFNILVLNILLHVSAFQNAVIRESDINTNTLNEWCICWSFTHHKKTHRPNCKNCKKNYVLLIAHTFNKFIIYFRIRNSITTFTRARDLFLSGNGGACTDFLFTWCRKIDCSDLAGIWLIEVIVRLILGLLWLHRLWRLLKKLNNL